MSVYYWPLGVPRVETLSAFEAAFATLGFVDRSDDRLEHGFEKVAIYVLGGTPRHAAQQLPNGQWTSKLGRAEDIVHTTLQVLEGPLYGTVATILKRSTLP